MFQALAAVRQATLAARSRKNDKRISTDVQQGVWRVVLVEGRVVTPLAEKLSQAEVVAFLEAM